MDEVVNMEDYKVLRRSVLDGDEETPKPERAWFAKTPISEIVELRKKAELIAVENGGGYFQAKLPDDLFTTILLRWLMSGPKDPACVSCCGPQRVFCFKPNFWSSLIWLYLLGATTIQVVFGVYFVRGKCPDPCVWKEIYPDLIFPQEIKFFQLLGLVVLTAKFATHCYETIDMVHWINCFDYGTKFKALEVKKVITRYDGAQLTHWKPSSPLTKCDYSFFSFFIFFLKSVTILCTFSLGATAIILTDTGADMYGSVLSSWFLLELPKILSSAFLNTTDLKVLANPGNAHLIFGLGKPRGFFFDYRKYIPLYLLPIFFCSGYGGYAVVHYSMSTVFTNNTFT